VKISQSTSKALDKEPIGGEGDGYRNKHSTSGEDGTRKIKLCSSIVDP